LSEILEGMPYFLLIFMKSKLCFIKLSKLVCNVKKRGVVFLTGVCLIVGCTEKMPILPSPIIKGRVGIVSYFPNKAVFQRAGTISVDNVSFYRCIPGLDFNSFLLNEIVKQLVHAKKCQPVPIYNFVPDSLYSDLVVRNHHLTMPYKIYLEGRISGLHLDYILLLIPGSIDFSSGEYDDKIWRVSGYGLFNHSFLFVKRNAVFVSLQAYLIDAKSYEVCSKTYSSIKVNRNDIKVTWHKGYSGISNAEMKKMSTIIQEKLSSSLRKLLYQLHLL